MQSIGTHAFVDCIALTQIVLPESLTSIGTQAFRGCTALTAVVIRTPVAEIGNHAFYGCSALTIYCEAQEEGENWANYWNSSYRPVVWGCTVADEGYILSYTKGTISNLDERNPLSAPVREGYDFAGWATSANGEVQYAADELGNVADGTTVYAVWTVAQPEPETPEETTEETSQEV